MLAPGNRTARAPGGAVTPAGGWRSGLAACLRHALGQTPVAVDHLGSPVLQVAEDLDGAAVGGLEAVCLALERPELAELLVALRDRYHRACPPRQRDRS